MCGKLSLLMRVIVNGLAPALNTMPLISGEYKKFPKTISVVFETPNVAVSADSLGTVAGVQFVAESQLLLIGLRFHVALPPEAGAATKSRSSSVGAALNKNIMSRRRRADRLSEVLPDEVVLTN